MSGLRHAQRQAQQQPRAASHRRCSMCRSNMLALRQRLHVRRDHRVKARIPIAFAPEHPRRRSPRFPPSRLVYTCPHAVLGGYAGQVSHNPRHQRSANQLSRMLAAGDNLRACAVEQLGRYSHEVIWNWMARHNMMLDAAVDAPGPVTRRERPSGWPSEVACPLSIVLDQNYRLALHLMGQRRTRRGTPAVQSSCLGNFAKVR